jgi:hypothetical protein
MALKLTGRTAPPRPTLERQERHIELSKNYGLNYAIACVCLYDTPMLASMIHIWATIRGLSLLVTTSVRGTKYQVMWPIRYHRSNHIVQAIEATMAATQSRL